MTKTSIAALAAIALAFNAASAFGHGDEQHEPKPLAPDQYNLVVSKDFNPEQDISLAGASMASLGRGFSTCSRDGVALGLHANILVSSEDMHNHYYREKLPSLPENSALEDIESWIESLPKEEKEAAWKTYQEIRADINGRLMYIGVGANNIWHEMGRDHSYHELMNWNKDIQEIFSQKAQSLVDEIGTSTKMTTKLFYDVKPYVKSSSEENALNGKTCSPLTPS